ncbi:MAG TPA: class I SAM-dependent methyltransferase [Chloroflexota bacterium]|nr:class I SAM-dependent methyltransferase [Chloroflexota bacterium]
MSQSYLTHLAALAAADIHPLGSVASQHLLAALDLQPGQRVLEIGCGTGGTMIRAARQTAVTVDGVDLLPEMLRAAQQRRRAGSWANTSLTQADSAALPFAGQTFDRVYSESVVGFQPEAAAEAMLRQIFRVLKPGGVYVANEAIWQAGVSPARVAAIYAACMADFGICQASPQAWGVDAWQRLMRQTGFQVAAADLLDEIVAAERAGDGRASPAATRFPRLSHWRRLAHPRLAWQSLVYRRRLARHRNDGQWLESRLFVLVKPEITRRGWAHE